MIQPNKCKQKLDNRQQCGAFVLGGKDYCFTHDPESREAHLTACKKGGSVKQIVVNNELQEIEVKTPDDVISLLNTTIKEVRAGTLDARVANTLGYLSSHLLKAFEIAQLDGKVEAIRGVLIERNAINERKKDERQKDERQKYRR